VQVTSGQGFGALILIRFTQGRRAKAERTLQELKPDRPLAQNFVRCSAGDAAQGFGALILIRFTQGRRAKAERTIQEFKSDCHGNNKDQKKDPTLQDASQSLRSG